MRSCRSLAVDTASAGLVPALLVTCVLALGSGLAACGGSADSETPPAATDPAPPAGPGKPPGPEPPRPATPSPPAETLQLPIAPPDPPLPDPPAELYEPSPPPAAPGDPAARDPAESPIESTATVNETRILRYDAYDLSGAVSEPGRYAFLADPNDPTSAVTTYEELRDGTATALLIHTHDAHGVPQTDLYDAVESGDLFEWRQAADCFVRYQVTEVQPDPTGAVPQKLLAVAWMTYAFTGCSGAIATTTATTLDWSDLPDLGGTSLTVPVIHGAFQIIPEGWTGETRPLIRQTPPTLNRDNPRFTTDITVARTFPYWREPALPEGIVLLDAEIDPEVSVSGYESYWGPSSRQDGISVAIAGVYPAAYEIPRAAAWRPNSDDLSVHETRIIAGRPAQVSYRPPGTTDEHRASITVRIHDPATGAVYIIDGYSPEYRGQNLSTVLAIARSLFANPPLLLYDTYDLSGTVTKPGHYAFLADPNDPNSVVTTYEELRDGTATALLIHATDAHGISQAALYAAVESGDLFEWRQADDCFVRYQVTAVQPDPTGTVPQKLLAVAWMTYAFTGCAGAIATTTAATLDWAELPDLGGTSLTTPIVHGIYQIVPENWTGATEAGTGHRPPGIASGPLFGGPGSSTDDLTVARGFRYWREPALPADWTFAGARAGGPIRTAYGYCATYVNAYGIGGVGICGDYAFDRRWAAEASWLARAADPTGGNQGVYETRMLAGRPARVVYSPPGPNHDPWFPIAVWVYDPATESQYYISPGEDTLLGSNIDGALAIARSLFAPPNPP